MEDLPIILVSALDQKSALAIITELIGEEAEAIAGAAGGNAGDSAAGRIWATSNKYYSARLRLLPWPDASTAAPPHANAHIIYLLENEGTKELEARASALKAEEAPAVCLALSRNAEPTLIAVARRLRYELVLLTDSPPIAAAPPAAVAPAAVASPASDESDSEDETGIERARSALHAHPWPNLRLHVQDRAREEAEEAAGEEAFIAAFEALRSARGVHEAPREERLARAEQVVVALCRALDLDDLDDLDNFAAFHDELNDMDDLDAILDRDVTDSDKPHAPKA